MVPNSPLTVRLRGKRKNTEDDDIEKEEIDIKRRVHHIVHTINPHTFPNGKYIEVKTYFITIFVTHLSFIENFEFCV